MSYPSPVGSPSQYGVVVLSEPAAPSSPPQIPAGARIITYSYASQLVYVTLAETYDDAIHNAKESFQELKNVERERIS